MTENDCAGKTTNIFFGREARELLVIGLLTAANAVSCTMGPKGKCALIQRDGRVPLVTKDGVTVSKSINLKIPIQRMGAELIREAAQRTNEVAGDGTTTATVLTKEMIVEGLKFVAAGYNTTELIRGIEWTVSAVIGKLNAIAKQIESFDEIVQIGTISANGDSDIGTLIADAMKKVGRDGIITVEDAKGMATTMDVVEGMQFERGYLSPYFVTNNEKMQAAYADACVLVTDKKISTLASIVPLLEDVKKNNKSLLIVADEIEGEALQGLILNKNHGQLRVVAIKAPGFGALKDQLLQDIATLTGATLVGAGSGIKLEDVRVKSHLGLTKKIIVDAKMTTIVATGKTAVAIQDRVAELKTQSSDVTLTAEERNILRHRIAKLASGVAIIKVGGTTEVEMEERKYRIEDALNATRAAVDEGIVPGGGSALFHVCEENFDLPSESTQSFLAGVQLIKKACQEPLRQICRNADVSHEVIIERMRTYKVPYGYNAANGEWVNLIDCGIIDPVKVTRTALQNASSVASTFLSLDAVIVENE